MISVNPPVHVPVAPVTVTGVGPVTWKFVPSGEMVLQSIFLLKCNFTSLGAQPGLATLSIGIGVGTTNVKATCAPLGISRSQLSRRELLSLPFFISTW